MESTSAASSAYHHSDGPSTSTRAGTTERHSNSNTRSNSMTDAAASTSSTTSRGGNKDHRSSSSSAGHTTTNTNRSTYQQSTRSNANGSHNGNNNAPPVRRNAPPPSSTNARDREYRSSRSSRSKSRDRSGSSGSSSYRDHRDRDRTNTSNSNSNNNSSRQRTQQRDASPPSSSTALTTNNPAVRLRERNNILQMHRTGVRRSTLSPSEIATRVFGLDTYYLKDAAHPHVTDQIGVPGVFVTDMALPEEKFRVHAMRSASYVNPLPRGFGVQWHLQYSCFSNKRTTLDAFDDRARAADVITHLDVVHRTAALASSDTSSPQQSLDHVFTSYLMRNVRRIDERTTHVWMSELAKGSKSIHELVQSFGVPFKQWRPLPQSSATCPLLDCVVRYRPGVAEATWFIQLNVMYTEMHEIKRDASIRLGDWFYSPKRLQRRAQGWTDQLIECLHALARQHATKHTSSSGKHKHESDKTTASMNALPPTAVDQTIGRRVQVPSRHGDTNVVTITATALTHAKWSYVLQLTTYQFELGLLDKSKCIDGLVSLLQKALTPRTSTSATANATTANNTTAVLALSINALMELVLVLQKLLQEILQSADATMVLVKTIVQHLRTLVPPSVKPVPDDLETPLHEELVRAFSQVLRDVLLHGYDILVRMDDGVSGSLLTVYWRGSSKGPSMWPAFVFTDRFFPRDAYSSEAIAACLAQCRQRKQHVADRIVRLQQTYPSAFNLASMRNEALVLQTLDRFHRTDASVDLQRVYNDVFVPFDNMETKELPVDVAAVFLVCEWAVTSHRPAEYRYLSALSLLEMHSNAVLAFGRAKKLLSKDETTHYVVLQHALQLFLQRFEPKTITEVTPLIDLCCLLVRRRLLSVEQFIAFASNCIEAGNTSILSAVTAVTTSQSSQSSQTTGVVPTPTAYNIECSPGRGYKSSDIHLLSMTDRLKLLLWQLPRGPFPLPTSIPMIPVAPVDVELIYLQWLDVLDLQPQHLAYAKTLERAQSLCVYVFHTHGHDASLHDASSRVAKEVEYQGKVGELVSAVKTMCGHDKGRFAAWFLRQIYTEQTFFRFSDFGSVEHIVRLVCLVLEIVDVLALLEVVVYFLRTSPVFLLKHVVIAIVERHEIAFCAAGQIPFLLQAFVDRFHRIPKSADDRAGSVAKFFCKLYYAHAKKKEIGKLDLPFALLRPIAETARKNQDVNNQQKQPKELGLEATNPIVRIPSREVIPPELKSALSRSFKALQAKTTGSGSGDRSAVNTPTPLQSPDTNANAAASASTAVVDVAFDAPAYASLAWHEIVGDASAAAEAKARDAAIDFAATAINTSMATIGGGGGSTNANATRERRTPNYVFFLRAVLSEVMDKWMANLAARIKSNCRRPIMTPSYVHRCVRLIREVVETHPDGDDFQDKFANTLVVWLQKEVLPAFSGSETQTKRTRNPFVSGVESTKEAFGLNQKGRLDKVQYGLKAFLVSLIIHKVLDLTQVLRLVLVPLFPRLRRASRDPPPNLPSQLLAIALVFQLFSEPPQNVLIEPQKIVMFDEPLTKYHLRFMRTQVPASLMFPLVHLLCQISYQMEDNFLLRKREERGTLASITLFNLTSDGIVRDIIFHDTKEAREKHILPVYHKKQWHTAVLLTHFFRPPNSPAEDANGQVQLLKVDQIIDQMTVWTLHRGGSIYLDLQMSRQQLKVKRSKKPRATTLSVHTTTRSGGTTLKRRAGSDLSTTLRPAKRQHLSANELDASSYVDDVEMDVELDNDDSYDVSDDRMDGDHGDASTDLDFDESSSATEILSHLIVRRTLQRSSRPSFLSASTTLCSVSPIATVQLVRSHSARRLVAQAHAQLQTQTQTPSQPPSAATTPSSSTSAWSNASRQRAAAAAVTAAAASARVLTDTERDMVLAARESQEAAVAALYAATVCSISRRAMGAVIAKVLQVLEDDVQFTQRDKFARSLNTTTVVRLLCGIMCTPPGSAFLPRFLMSLAVQLEWLYDGCRQYDLSAGTGGRTTAPAGAVVVVAGTNTPVFLKRLRKKLAMRLQLVAVLGQSKHVALTICYRDRIAKTLFSLLGTSAVATGVGVALFSWILDLLPLVSASVLHDNAFSLVESLQLPDALKRRVWTVFPRSAFGTQPLHVAAMQQQRRSDDEEDGATTTIPTAAQAHAAVDPWGLLEHVPQLPSDALVAPVGEKVARRRRVFRYVL